jgi:hypothetical protein
VTSAVSPYVWYLALPLAASSPRQMFLAQVLCGTCHDFGTAHGRDLKRPPSVPGKEHELCDSVKVSYLQSRHVPHTLPSFLQRLPVVQQRLGVFPKPPTVEYFERKLIMSR